MQNEFTFKNMQADTKVSHFVEVMSPFERPCYDFSIQVEKAAEAFAVSSRCPPHPQMEPAVDFNRIDCSLSHDLCDELRSTACPTCSSSQRKASPTTTPSRACPPPIPSFST